MESLFSTIHRLFLDAVSPTLIAIVTTNFPSLLPGTAAEP
jgi:hypothetical protein